MRKYSIVAWLALVLLTVLIVDRPSKVTATGNPVYFIVGGGQSLSLGHGGTPPLSTTTNANVLTVSGSTFTTYVESGLESPLYGMARELVDLTGGLYSFAVVNTGTNGVPYTTLKRIPTFPGLPITGSTYYSNGVTVFNNAVTAASNASRTLVAAASVITHGEDDTQANTSSGPTYSGYMSEWQGSFDYDYRRLLPSQTQIVPQFYSQMSTWPSYAYTTPTYPKISPTTYGVPLAMYYAARDNPGVIMLGLPKYQYNYEQTTGAAAYTNGVGSGDDVHLNNESYRHLGIMYAKAIYRHWFLHLNWYPLAPRSLSRSGAVITAQFWLPGGTALALDTTSVNKVTRGGTESYGFEYWNDSGLTLPTITTTPSISGDTITLTLSSTPTGFTVEKLRYAYTGTSAGYGGTAGQSGLNMGGIGGNLRDNDTLTAYTGAPMYDWAVTFDETLPFTLAWNPSGNTAPLITSACPTGTARQWVTYSPFTMTASGTTPLTWSISAGALPAGMTIDSSTGVVSGTPTGTGVASFTIQVANGTSPNDTKACSITVSGATVMIVGRTRMSGGVVVKQ